MMYLGSNRVVTNSFSSHKTAEDYAGNHLSNVVMYGKGKVVRIIDKFLSHEDSINYNTFLKNESAWRDGNYYNCISITGKSVRMKYDELGGNQVFIETYDGDKKLQFCFAHLDSILVKVGDIVDANVVIGRQGNTGLVLSSKNTSDTTYGSHVHLEILDRNGNYIDPRKYASGEVLTTYLEQSNIIDNTKEQIHILVDKINIRAKATVLSDDIGDVYFNEVYTVLDSTDDGIYTWYHIETSLGLQGYVASKHNSNWVELYSLKYPDNNNDVTEDDRFKLIFTCPGDDTYYIKLKKGEKLYIEDLEDTK